jgi:small subunit ribosomal protein S17
MEKRTNRRKFLTGTVLSDKMNKTRVVQISWKANHKKYLKPVRRAGKFKVHDEKNEAKTGDVVRIMETRPLSREKCWIIRDVVQAGSK